MINPSKGGAYQKRPPTRMTRYSAGTPTPEDISSTIKRLETGHVERWARLIPQMLRDAHVRATYDTLLAPLASAELVFDAQTAEQEEDAKVLGELWSWMRRPAETLAEIAHGHGLGWSILEKDWARRGGLWYVREMVPVEAVDTRLTDEYEWEVRTWPTESGARPVWLSTNTDPSKWLVHNPQQVGLAPQMGGLLLACAWPWNFSTWADVWGAEALEREGVGTWLGLLPEGANVDAEELREELETLTTGKVGVLRDGTTVELLESAHKAGEAHTDAIGRYQADITKALLGSTLNTDVGDTGGNRALGESQAEMTIVPRHLKLASSIAGTLTEQWAAHVMALNPMRFNGRTIPPKLSLEVVTEEPAEITQLMADNGAATVDELRQSGGLEPWGDERGGNKPLTPLAKTAPMFNRSESTAWTQALPTRTLRTSTRSPRTQLSALDG